MSLQGQKYLGLAAVTLGIIGIAAFGAYEIAVSCDGEKEAKSASAVLTSSDGDGEAGYSCGSKKASAALVSSDGGSCSFKHARAAYVFKDGAACDMSACAEYNACSVNADLASAKGDAKKAYGMEKAMDGVAIENFKLPEFTAYDLNGEEMSSSDLIGQPTVLVLLASHCGHSYKSRPILEQAASEFGSKGLRVVGLMVGSTNKSASSWFDANEINHEVWVTSDKSVADALQSHLVPTYVLIDAEGNVKTKLVGFKKEAEVTKSISPLLVRTDSDQESQEG